MPLSTSLLLLSPLIAAVLLLFSGDLPISFSQDDAAATAAYPNCHRTFTCGSLNNITYPFIGGDRPDYCGLPEFRLRCRDGYSTEFTTNSETYRVLQIDQTAKTLTLARLDLWNNPCPRRFANSTFNSSILNPSSGNEALTLSYGCSSLMTVKPFNEFDCDVSGSYSSDSYYFVGPVPIDPVLSFVTCFVSIQIPVLRDAAARLIGHQTSLPDALTEGFSVNYSDPYEKQCYACGGSGGQCGFEPDLGEPVCICAGSGSLCPVATTSRNEGNKRSKLNVPLTVGLSVTGAVLFGLALGWLVIAYRLKKKRIAAQSAEASQTKSKDLPSTLSSGGLTSTTGFSRSTPSYPSSTYDIEKGSTYFGVQVFTYAELEEATNNFDPSRELGDGGFGTVYYGKLHDNRIVAVKRLYENNFKRVEQFLNEVEILTRLRHENLVKLYGCTSKRSRELLLVYEYISNGTVADHLHGSRVSSHLLSWPVRLNIAIETANALAYLHASEIIHRDVKTNNILLDNDFRVKVADFGLSRLFPTDVTHVSTAPQGTPGYVDPDYYQCYQLTTKSDVYSFGVVLIELISSKQAVDTNRHRHDINLSNMAINRIQNHALHELVDPSIGFETDTSVRRMTTLVAELAFRCLQQETDMRPSMEEVLEALRGIKNEDLNAEKAEVVDIMEDDVGCSKANPPPMSPDLWLKSVSSSTTPNSSG